MQLSRHRLEELLAHHTGQPVERIAADIERDYIVRGDEAVEYGLVDEIIHRRRQLNVVPGFTRTADEPTPEDGTSDDEGDQVGPDTVADD